MPENSISVEELIARLRETAEQWDEIARMANEHLPLKSHSIPHWMAEDAANMLELSASTIETLLKLIPKKK